jgi:hypothetical protein
MLKMKLIAAGILSISALVLSVPAIATSNFSNKNYSGRYACHENDGTGAFGIDTNFTSGLGEGGGVTSAYVVNPEGNGYYASGTLILNIAALGGENPCTFTLYTSTSSYYVDYSGIVHEYLNWTDDTTGSSADYCSGDSFYHEVEGSLALLTQVATETKTTANIYLDGIDFAGSGECVLSAF